MARPSYSLVALLVALVLFLSLELVGAAGEAAANGAAKQKKAPLFGKKQPTAAVGSETKGAAGSVPVTPSAGKPASGEAAAPEKKTVDGATPAGTKTEDKKPAEAAPGKPQAAAPKAPRPRALHKIPEKFANRGRNLESFAPEERHKHCDEDECRVGACTFVDCENPVNCRGGGCTFYKCKNPSCSGGACKFIECENPTCSGGACDFIESTKIAFDGQAHCTGGACTIEGAQHVGSPVGDAVCE
jgi:hypothetical protein